MATKSQAETEPTKTDPVTTMAALQSSGFGNMMGMGTAWAEAFSEMSAEFVGFLAQFAGLSTGRWMPRLYHFSRRKWGWDMGYHAPYCVCLCHTFTECSDRKPLLAIFEFIQ